MKKFALVFVFICSVCALFAQETEINGCYVTSYYGNETHCFEAYGNVYVETDPTEPVDMDVLIVDSPQKASYNIYKTADTPKKCGEWRFVTDRSKAKFTIRYVKELEDCSIYFTTNRNQTGF